MKNSGYIKNIVGSGMLIGLVLSVIVAFKVGDTLQANNTSAEAAAPMLVEAAPSVSLDQAQALQAQNEELRQVIETMQAREQEYQTQLEAANAIQGQNGELVQALTEAQTNIQAAQGQAEVVTALQAQNAELGLALETMQAREQEYLTQLEAATALQNRNGELTQALQTMQDRERQYQAQIETANQTIQQLQTSLNNANQGGNHEYEEEDDD